MYEAGLDNFKHGISLRISLTLKSNISVFMNITSTAYCFFSGHYLSPPQTPAQSRTLLSRWMVSNTSFSFPCKKCVRKNVRESTHKRDHITNRSGVLICRLHSETEYSRCMWVTATFLLKSISVTHHFIDFWTEHKDRKTIKFMCRPINILNTVCICHLLISSLHNLSGKWILSTKLNFQFYKLPFQVFPQRMNQHMFVLFQHYVQSLCASCRSHTCIGLAH